MLAVSLFALFAACSSSDSDDDNGDGGDGDTPSAEQSPTDGGDGGDGDGGDGDGNGDGDGGDGDISQLAAQWAESEGLIAYEYTTAAGGQETSGAMTLFWQPPNWRIDYDAGDGSTSTNMLVDGVTYVCGGDSCISYDSPDAAPVPFPFFSLFMDPEGIGSDIAGSFGGVDFDTSSETIAGQSAECFTSSVEAGGAGTEAEYCWGEDGGQLLRLRTETNVGGQSSSYTLEATEVGDVSAADFEPPYPVTTIPGT
jgi:hypothetical protein